MGALADTAFALASLEEAWEDVLANDQRDDVLSPGVRRFADRIDEQLAGLHSALTTRRYAPRALAEVPIRSEQGVRVLHIPAAPDRVVARSILNCLIPVVDPVLGASSYAYRPGLGVHDAIQAVVALRDEGLRWVLRTDVKDCFPTVPRAVARGKLFALLGGDHELAHVLRLLLRRRARVNGRRKLTTGLPQGCALSPLIANLVLVDLDDRLSSHGYPIVRYADDLVVATPSKAEAWEAASMADEFLADLGMGLNDDKTAVISFDDGFSFLGEEFGAKLPPLVDDHRVIEPDRRVLYVGTDGCRLRVARGRMIVDSKDEVELLDVPTSQVGRLVCFGSVGISAGVRAWALTHDVEIILASRRGSHLGAIVQDRWTSRGERLRAQLALRGSAREVGLARSFVEAKIRKQIVVLRRFSRRDSHEQVRPASTEIAKCLEKLPTASTLQELMGLEGAAARAYFPALGQLMPTPLRFSLRSRQPPRDVPNAALSYLYAVLLGEAVLALRSAGLDPALGILHAEDSNRPSLGLDLIEEFRPLIVDQVVVHLARIGSLAAEHGTTVDDEGVLLTAAGKGVILRAYENRMLQHTKGALPGFAGTWRRHLYRQAHRLRTAIMDPDASWTGTSWR